MKLISYVQENAFGELQSEWNELVQRSTSDRVFSMWEWQCTWWAAYHPGSLWIIVCRDDNGRLLGIAPWFIELNERHGRVVRSIGCIEVTDYLDLILDTEHVEAVLDALADFVAENHEKYDLIDLCNLPEGSPGQAQFPEKLTQRGFSVSLSIQEVCPIIPLPSQWDAYFELLDKKQRHELRRKLRRAESAEEQVDWYIVGKNHDLDKEVEYFLKLMAASHPEKARFLTDPQNVQFFRHIVPVAAYKDWLQLCFLTVNGERVAAYLNFVYKGHVLVYNSGLLPNQYSHLSTGIVLLANTIRHAIEAGYTVFDFLRGNEVYKYRMGGQDTRVYMLKAQLAAN